MITPVKLTPQLTRVISHYKKFDIEVPKALLEMRPKAPDLTDFPYPLPQKKSDYTCFCESQNGVIWYGSSGGVTRFDKNAELLCDKVMYFSAQRDLMDNNVKSVVADGDGVWVLTDSGVTHIDMVKMTMQQKAYRLLDETLTYVQRHGMVSNKNLSEPLNVKSAVDFGHSDNDGGFTAAFAIGEIFHYATLRREKGEFNPETVHAREVAMRASEATLLTMFISGRGDGFVSRSYVTKSEPLPDDGLFFKKNGATAVCLNTTEARKRKLVGFEVKADEPIPERLRKLYTDEGYEDTDIIYKSDTSSDEITLHYLHILVAHEFFGGEDPEYDSLLKLAATNTMSHIIKGGYALIDANGSQTTWARWNMEYFKTYDGWADACLNAQQLLMYLRVTMRVTGESGIWQKEYDKLIEMGYADLAPKHFDRFHQVCMNLCTDDREGIMYGDHALAVFTYWGLITLEPDEKLKEKFREGFRSWRYSLAPEFNPGYDFLYNLGDPDNAVCNPEMIKMWFYRFGVSRLAAGVSLDKRRDIPKKLVRCDYFETSSLLPNDERFIAKYDRNPLEFKNEDSGGAHSLESCYPFTFAYWVGRYFKFIEEADANE